MFMQRASDDFASLVRSLRLKASFELAAPLISRHLEMVHGLLQRFVQDDPLVSEPIIRALAKLPEDSHWRLLTSPYLCEFLMISNGDLLPVRRQIVQALVAEIRRVDPGFESEVRPLWTIDGDVVLDARIAARFPALSTACGIRLNYQSDIHNTGKPGIAGYNYAMGLRHLERLETALNIITQVSPPAQSMVNLFTTGIQVRQNVNRPNVVNSSTHTSIGLVRCDNFHLLHGDMPEIVDMLVHESIHQYLHLFEEQLFSFVQQVPQELLDQRVFPSPWSGSLLDLRSYTHAVFVWYGLWNFWNDYIRSGYEHAEVTSAQAREKRGEAEIGFVNSQSVLDNLGEASSYLDVEYAKQVRDIQMQLQRPAKAI
jgi:hypothetical protein